MQDSKSLHYVLGAALALIAVFVVIALVMINSQALVSNTQVTIDNVAPTVTAIFVSNDAEPGDGTQQADDYPGGTINTLVAGSTKNLYITGVVSDTNGAADITAVAGALFRTTQTEGCSADENDCYIDASCDLYAYNTTSKYFNCGPFAVQYYADSTSTGGANPTDTWTADVNVDDGTTTGSDTLVKEMQTLLSVSVTDAINYGTLALGASTTNSNNQVMTVTQQGNDEADIEVSSGAVMSCTTRGSIPVANQQWALTDVSYGGEGVTALSGTPTDTNVNVGYRTSSEVTQSIYWNITIPSVAVEGICTGVTTATAIAH